MAKAMLRWGLLGASTIARERMAGAIRRCGGEIRAVFSSSQDRGAVFAASLDIPRHTTGFADFFDGLDAVYVSSLNNLHHAHVLAAAAAGLHVLCEKPLALSLAEADAMIEACTKAGVVLGVDHHLRGSTINRTMAGLIGDGAIGRPVFARVVNAGVLPETLYRGRMTPEAGGGILFDKATHDGDLLRYLLQQTPLEVSATADEFAAEPSAVARAVMSTMRFPSGLIAQTFDAFNAPFSPTEVVVHGTAGALYATDCLSGRLAGSLRMLNGAGERIFSLDHVDPYSRIINAFHHAIRNADRPIATGSDGRLAVSIALAMTGSVRSRSAEPVYL